MQSDRVVVNNSFRRLLFGLLSQVLTVRGGEDYGSCYPNTLSDFSYFAIS